MRRKSKKAPLQVTSFRLPLDVHEFLRSRAKLEDQNMTQVLVGVLRLWMNYHVEQAKQPRAAK